MKNIYTKQLLKELFDLSKRKNKMWLSGTLTASIIESRNTVFGNNESQLSFFGFTSITANTFANTNCSDASRNVASFSFLVLDTSQEMELIAFSRKKNYPKTKTINIYNATLTQPATAVTSDATSNNISCFNASDGQIDVSGSNGVLPYLYSIDNGAHYQTGSSFTNLPAGNYKIRVKDINGCESAAQ